ncbi:MAG: virulence RhuM family protein [Gammaproteobacteria bacterium]|nr:virulence RhuM family protein [Gammaproteobacteria bacterium]
MVRSSAAEYLTFIAASGQGGVEAVYAEENVWITQKMMGLLYDVNVRTVNEHLKKIFGDNELQEDSVIRKFRITASDGKNYNTQHYSLPAIIAVGYKVNSERAVQFRKWATGIIEQFTIKAYVMDDERIKAGGSVLTDQYFEEQLQRIREIRLSERKFYQKITDIYATAMDYDVTAQATKRFFATVQNKLHWAIHGQTAAEVVYHRADADQPNMGLTTWKDAPAGKIQKFDVVVAKNYLTELEMAQLSRLVNAYLDVAEDMAQRKIPMTMQDWETRLNRFIEATDREVLQDAGKVTAEIAKAHAESEFEKYRIVQDRLFQSDFDRLLNQIEPNSQPEIDED